MPRMKKNTKSPMARGTTRFHLEDPYIPRGGWHEPTICPACNCVYTAKRWSYDSKILDLAKRNPKKQHSKCPGCKKIEDHFVMGIVYIEGDFFGTHTEDVLGAVKSEERRAKAKNPLERIMTISKGKDTATIETTSDQLALRIGRRLHSSYSGDVEFKFSQDQKIVRVMWRRYDKVEKDSKKSKSKQSKKTVKSKRRRRLSR